MTASELKQWVRDAIDDGWEAKATFPEHESMDTASSLTKGGWKAMVFLRDKETSIGVWGPDSLQVLVPTIYNMKALEAALRTCQYCKETDIDTVRISFGGRCCKKCRIELVPKLEYPGWTN